MAAYRMPLVSRPRGLKLEWFPKYRDLLRDLAPGQAWHCVKEEGRQWDQVIAENGSVLVVLAGEVQPTVHLVLASMIDVEVVAT